MNVQTIRESAILTTSYVAWDVIEKVRDGNVLVLHIDFTKWSLTTAEIQVECSSSGNSDDYYVRTSWAITSGAETIDTHYLQLDATGKYEIILPVYADYIKISAKGTGTVTGSAMAIKAITGRA